MGFRKLGLFYLMLSFQLHLLPAFPVFLKNILLTDFDLQQIERNKEILQERLLIEVGSKHVVSVNRRGGGGGGGHGGGGGGHGGGGEGGHPGGEGAHGDKTPFMGGAVIPLYAAGAAGGAQHRNDHGHHGKNAATPLCSGLNFLVLAVLTFLIIFV